MEIRVDGLSREDYERQRGPEAARRAFAGVTASQPRKAKRTGKAKPTAAQARRQVRIIASATASYDRADGCKEHTPHSLKATCAKCHDTALRAAIAEAVRLADFASVGPKVPR